eukprot:472856-Amphidinium_carterae.1
MRILQAPAHPPKVSKPLSRAKNLCLRKSTHVFMVSAGPFVLVHEYVRDGGAVESHLLSLAHMLSRANCLVFYTTSVFCGKLLEGIKPN